MLPIVSGAGGEVAQHAMSSHAAFVELSDVRLRVRVAGCGPALVLLHGWALDAAMWEPQFAALTRTCHLIAIDRRGFGSSSGDPDLNREADDVRQLLDTLAIERASILGMSQAARVALQFAQQHPTRVHSLILDGPPALSEPGGELPLESFRELVRTHGIESFRQQWSMHPFMRLHTRDAHMQSLLAAMIARYPGRDLQRTSSPAVRLAPPNIAAPSLIINGALDTAARRLAGQELAQQLPESQHVIIPGAGHLPNLDSPAAYNAHIVEFMHRHAALSSTGE